VTSTNALPRSRDGRALTSVQGVADARRQVAASELPAWPVVSIFAAFPLWWVLGLADLIWVLMALPMALLLLRSGQVRAPRGFGVYLLFLAWVLCSASQLERAGQAIGFGYRFALYLSAAVLFLYTYNARRRLTDRLVTGALTGYWLATVLGGYLALAAPLFVLRTPLSYLLPEALTSNDLVNHMVVRRMTQWNPDGWAALDPRPTAPFLYTNNWGNVYSLVMPFVVAYLFHVWGRRRFWVVLAAVPVSMVPAFLTLNRGMFLGLGLAVAYAGLRLLLMRQVKAVAAIAVAALAGVGVFLAMPAGDRLEHRVTESSSTEDRASLYVQALETVPDSPILGHAAPVEASNPDLDPVGTQGQFWMILVAHGVGAVLLFVGWFVTAFARSVRRTDVTGLAASTVLLVGTMELLYYGALPYGLPVLMIAAALALRWSEDPPTGRKTAPTSTRRGRSGTTAPALRSRPARPHNPGVSTSFASRGPSAPLR
jgi:O-antigen ligase